MASNQPHTKRDVGGQKDDKPKGKPGQAPQPPTKPASKPVKS
jgi:hypothetical protein